MDREEIQRRMNELDKKDELTIEEQREYDDLWSMDWDFEEEDIRQYMYGY